jgi:hypothetical protein
LECHYILELENGIESKRVLREVCEVTDKMEGNETVTVSLEEDE